MNYVEFDFIHIGRNVSLSNLHMPNSEACSDLYRPKKSYRIVPVVSWKVDSFVYTCYCTQQVMIN